MYRCLFIALMGLLTVLCLKPAPALAALHICNQTSTTLFVAVATNETNGSLPQSRGWWEVAAGRCRTVSAAKLTPKHTAYYYYYEAVYSGRRMTSGTSAFCVSDGGKFAYSGDAAQKCESSGSRNFNAIDGITSGDYTLNITTLSLSP